MTTQCWQRCSNDDDDVAVVVLCCIHDCVNGGIYGLSKEWIDSGTEGGCGRHGR